MDRALFYSTNSVDGIKLTNLKNRIHGEFIHDALMRALETPAIVQNLPAQLARLERAVENETRAGFKDISDSITKLIYEELDPERDRVETAMKSGFRAMMDMPDEEVSQAAKEMWTLVQKHKLQTRQNVDAQTDAIRDFIADVDANHMETLRKTTVAPLFEKLRAANDAVCDAMVQRDEADSTKVTAVMAEARRESDEAYRDLMHGVDAYAYVQGTADYADFISYMNALIRRYKRVHLGQTVASPEAAPGDTVDGDEVVDQPGDDNNGGGNDTPTGGDNGNTGNENPGGGSIPTNPQPGDGDDPDL